MNALGNQYEKEKRTLSLEVGTKVRISSNARLSVDKYADPGYI